MLKLYAASLFAVHQDGIAKFIPATFFALSDDEAQGKALNLARQRYPTPAHTSHSAVVMVVPETAIKQAYEKLTHG